MITKIWITFQAENIPGHAAKILKPSGCGPDVSDVLDLKIMDQRKTKVTIKLEATDDRVARVRALLQQYGVEMESFTYQDYSEDELQSARLLRISVVPTWWVSAGALMGTEYDLTDACRDCNAGARQSSVLYLSDSGQKNFKKFHAMGTTENGILVDADLRKELVDAGVTGISFGEARVRHSKKKWSAAEHQLVMIERVMPPMPGELGEDDEKQVCKVCRRGGRRTWPDMPYREADLVGMQDFNLSWEWFGEFHAENKDTGQVALWPRPDVLVTPKVMNIFRNAGVKSFDWKPVGIAP